MSLKQNNQIGSNLIGGAIAVFLAVPIAAFLGSLFGDSYQTRSTVYILILAWVIAGAFTIGFISKKTPEKTSGRFLFLWIISTWLWPALLATYFLLKKSK